MPTSFDDRPDYVALSAALTWAQFKHVVESAGIGADDRLASIKITVPSVASPDYALTVEVLAEGSSGVRLVSVADRGHPVRSA